MCTLQRRVVVGESVTWANLDDESILLNVKTGVYYGLDAIGTRIWSLLVEGMSEADIVSRFVAEYDVEPERVSTDVSDLIDQLTAKGLVSIADE